MGPFNCFNDLTQIYKEGIDYRITVLNRGGRILIIAPHGGGIEGGTSELALEIAGEDISLYLFEAILFNGNKKLHIASTKFNEPQYLNLITKFETSLAIHGCGGKEPKIHVGGKNQELMSQFINKLSERGYPALLGSSPYAGIAPTNICNRTTTARGVQLELSQGLRYLMFTDWKKTKGRNIKTDLFEQFVLEIRALVQEVNKYGNL